MAIGRRRVAGIAARDLRDVARGGDPSGQARPRLKRGSGTAQPGEIHTKLVARPDRPPGDRPHLATGPSAPPAPIPPPTIAATRWSAEGAVPGPLLEARMAGVGVGIVGSGFMGRTWAETTRRTQGAQLVAVSGGLARSRTRRRLRRPRRRRRCAPRRSFGRAGDSRDTAPRPSGGRDRGRQRRQAPADRKTAREHCRGLRRHHRRGPDQRRPPSDRVATSLPEVAAGSTRPDRRGQARRDPDDPRHRSDRRLRRPKRHLEGRPRRTDRVGRLGRARL